MNEITAHFFR